MCTHARQQSVQVYMKAINHQLNWMLDKTIADFIPEKRDILKFGTDLMQCAVPDVNSMRVLKFASCLQRTPHAEGQCAHARDCGVIKVVDQEKTQNKALQYLLRHTHLRCAVDADFAHQKWNVVKGAMKRTGIGPPYASRSFAPWGLQKDVSCACRSLFISPRVFATLRQPSTWQLQLR